MGNNKSNIRIVHIPGAAQHEALMRGVITAMRLSITSTEKRDGDEDRLIALIDLLDDLLPDERELKH